MSVFDNWENGRANAEEEIIQLRKCAEEDAKALDLQYDPQWIVEEVASNVDTVEAINAQEAEYAKIEAKVEARKALRKQASKRRKAYRSAYAEAAEACGLVKCRVNGKVFWE